MALSMKLVVKEVFLAGCKNIPLIGPAVEVVDNIYKSHESLQIQDRLDHMDSKFTSFDRKMRDLVKSEIETTVAGLSQPNLTGDEFSKHIKNLYDIRANGWSPAFFQGLLERSLHWPKLAQNPSHYGTVLGDRDSLDGSKLPIFIDADKTRILELTPFALHSLLAGQIGNSPHAKIVASSDVWAFVSPIPPTQAHPQTSARISSSVGGRSRFE